MMYISRSFGLCCRAGTGCVKLNVSSCSVGVTSVCGRRARRCSMVAAARVATTTAIVLSAEHNVGAAAAVDVDATTAALGMSDVQSTVLFQYDEDGASLDLADEVAHISTACKMLKHNGVEVASVSLLGWTLRYHLRSTFKSGDWYATSPEGGVYRSHKALQRRVPGRKYPVARV